LKNILKNYDIGILIIRLGIGIPFFFHGLPKLTGGVETWLKLGGKMSLFGIDFLPEFWGFAAAFAETFGGIFVALGIFWRFSNFILLSTMIVAVRYHLASGDGFGAISHALEAGALFLGLLFISPGKYSLSNLVKIKK